MRKRLTLLVVLTIATIATPNALADSGGATIRSLPESEEIQVTAEVRHDCPEYLSESYSTCDWFAEVSTYPSSVECPYTFDASHDAWSGMLETTPGASRNTFAVLPYGLPRDIHVCLYVYAENESTLVGRSHTFDRVTGREVLPKPTTRNCGTTRADELSWNVVVLKGTTSCAVARNTMHAYMHGSGVPTKATAINARILHGGWHCGEIITKEVVTEGVKQPIGEPVCVRQSSRGIEEIEANLG